MEENQGYLKYLINEQIYVVKEPELVVADDTETSLAESRIEKVVKDEPILEAIKPETSQEKEVLTEPTQKLLVVYKYPESEPLPTNLKKLMLKIIEAVGIDVMTGVYVNSSFKPLPDQLLDFENILVFGKDITLKLEDSPQSQPYRMETVSLTRILTADALIDLDQQIPLKRQLWAELQRMFPKN